jgi:hypothetical protein
MLFAYIERGVLQDTRNEANLVRGVRRDEGVSGAAEVVQAHGFAESCREACPDNVVNPACR